MKVGLHANPNKPAALELARRTLEVIGSRAEVVLSEEIGAVEPARPHAPWERLDADVIVAIGGDGTFLHAARRTSVSLLPVNAGTFGVLAEVDGRAPGGIESAGAGHAASWGDREATCRDANGRVRAWWRCATSSR